MIQEEGGRILCINVRLRSEQRENQPAHECHKLKFSSGLSYESYNCNY